MPLPFLTTSKLSNIQRSHSKLAELLTELKLPPLVTKYCNDLPPEALRILLEISPIAVKSFKGGYECIGGVRQWALAKLYFKDDDLISVLVYPDRLDVQAMQRRVLVELFQQPTLLGLSQGDTRAVKAIAGALEKVDENLVAELGLGTKAQQSCWSKVSERTLNRV